MKRIGRSVLLGFVCGGHLVGATTPMVYADKDQPCAEDIRKLCADVQPGGGRVLKCLQDRENDVAPACRQRVLGVQAELNAVPACREDWRHLCATAGPGQIAGCLRANEARLSTGCRENLKKASPGGSRTQKKAD